MSVLPYTKRRLPLGILGSVGGTEICVADNGEVWRHSRDSNQGSKRVLGQKHATGVYFLEFSYTTAKENRGMPQGSGGGAGGLERECSLGNMVCILAILSIRDGEWGTEGE